MASPFISWPDPRFQQVAAPVEKVDPDLWALGARLMATARELGAYGLAAVHLGSVAPVVVVGADQTTNPGVYVLMFNPKITASAVETDKGEEGSVSLPNVRVQVERPVWIEVDFLDSNNAPQHTRLEGFAARVAQHEIDQMNGIFFLDRVSRLKRDMALKKGRKLAG